MSSPKILHIPVIYAYLHDRLVNCFVNFSDAEMKDMVMSVEQNAEREDFMYSSINERLSMKNKSPRPKYRPAPYTAPPIASMTGATEEDVEGYDLGGFGTGNQLDVMGSFDPSFYFSGSRGNYSECDKVKSCDLGRSNILSGCSFGTIDQALGQISHTYNAQLEDRIIRPFQGASPSCESNQSNFGSQNSVQDENRYSNSPGLIQDRPYSHSSDSTCDSSPELKNTSSCSHSATDLSGKGKSVIIEQSPKCDSTKSLVNPEPTSTTAGFNCEQSLTGCEEDFSSPVSFNSGQGDAQQWMTGAAVDPSDLRYHALYTSSLSEKLDSGLTGYGNCLKSGYSGYSDPSANCSQPRNFGLNSAPGYTSVIVEPQQYQLNSEYVVH